jgi:hypothetical protein
MTDSDQKLAQTLVEAAGEYASVIDSAEAFNLEEYRKAELALHEAALLYGRRLRALREKD